MLNGNSFKDMQNIKVISFNRDDKNSSSYNVAWDGDSTPDVTKIPAGVVVSYNSQDYTGTLTASEDTLDNIYLVGAEGSNEYTRYVTNATDQGFSWLNIGSTEMNLAGYVQYEAIAG